MSLDISPGQLICYDLRGCGRSEGPLKEEAYSSERQAEEFKVVIEAYGVTKPFVATWSMGGTGIIPPDVMAKYGPESLAGHIMMGSCPHLNMNGEIMNPVILGLFPGLMTEDIALFAKTLPEFILSFVSPKYKLPYDVYAKWLGGVAPRYGNLCMGINRTMPPIMKIADRFPYLAIQGEDDQYIVPEKLEKWMKDHLSQSDVHLLPGVGHAPFYKAPEITNKLILGFVEKHSSCCTDGQLRRIAEYTAGFGYI
ncbi:alpha/beta-hydrolase [Gymnopus androsaceus JB14]|uniref:Alpha/beta-hydrolase n=1 Tax=Gymnopus androsaceus JB14 TaxID=1447944 RepID=A0A6A4IJF8_9AGAR|nr:alpha/beta-hydrolase [Gymnopus androsaceus JB14]